MKGTTQGSDIVQVEGGHIIRSTGRKDRHSKVYTSKGPRDRRLRLSAHTAIQFYDVQDRLGYDRPSKAVDWLIKKAKTSIDKLDELAPPKDCSNPSSNDLPLLEPHYTPHPDFSFAGGDLQPDSHFVNTVRSFFPAAAANFPGFSGDDSASRGEDLGLSLHSFQQGFQMINGWSTNGNSTGEMDGGGRVGTFVMSPPPAAGRAAFSDHGMPFSQRELLQSNLSVNPWNHHHSHRPLANYDHNSHPKSTNSSDFEIPFELGFRVPARIYGEEDSNSHR